MIELLGQGKKYYESVFGEAEIVATAYCNFGNRVTKVKHKLTEKIPELARGGSDSPVPSPDYDAPSPEGEEREGQHGAEAELTPLPVSGSDDEMEIKLPDEAGSDLSSRLSGMNKDRYSISEWLTKMAHGESVDVDSFISGGGGDRDRKRRRTSGGGGYDPATAGMFDTPQPRPQDPWSDHHKPPPALPPPDWLSGGVSGLARPPTSSTDFLTFQVEEEEVENVALARLKQAAHKNNKGLGDNGVMNSNLVPLTGSPGLRPGPGPDKERRVSDMDLSDGENGDSRHHPVWDRENGRDQQQFHDRFSAPPPHLLNQPPPGGPGGPGGPPPPRMTDLNVSLPPGGNFGGFEDGSGGAGGRGGFRLARGDRGGFGSRGGYETPPRFPGAPGKPRFPGPGRGGFHLDRFSEGSEGGEGGFRGRGGFRGHHNHKDFDGSRGSFDRGRGGRGGWNNNRRPWGNPRGRGRASW